MITINNLASVLLHQGKYAEAEAFFRQAAEGREKTLGPKHPDTLASIQDLATVRESRRNLKAQATDDSAK